MAIDIRMPNWRDRTPTITVRTTSGNGRETITKLQEAWRGWEVVERRTRPDKLSRWEYIENKVTDSVEDALNERNIRVS